MSLIPTINAPYRSSKFDQQSLVDSVNDIGNAHRTRALQLISDCRFLVRTLESNPDSYARLRNVSQLVDDALNPAMEAEIKISAAPESFETAINVTSGLKGSSSSDPLTNRQTVGAVTKEVARASMNNMSGVPVADVNPKEMRNESSESTREIEFLLLRSLPDKHPIIVKQVLSENPSLAEILWSFSRFKDERRLTLKRNPHFYARLPMSTESYGGGFTMEPTEDFRHEDKFYVLTDRQGLAYFETGQYTRCFGNFWCPNGAIIFKDLSGRLAGEEIIKATLKTKHWQFCTQPLVSASPILSTVGNARICRRILTLECPCENWIRQIDGLPGCDDIHLIACAGRAAPDSPLLTPLPPTSEQPQYSVTYRAHIYMLNYDVLLNIFHHYRMEDVNSWNRRLGWCKLTNVCRRWRYLIYDSSFLLDMHLLVTNGSPTLESLTHLPPLPLVIDYCNTTTTRARQDELGILTGLQQRGRVRRIFLRVPSPRLGICLATMSGPYPILEELSLTPPTEEEMSLVPPSTFSARNLRHLELQGVGFPNELPLFTHFTTLVTLTLTRIPAPYYFHPGHLVTQLQGLLHLEALSIGFAVPIPVPSTEEELLPPPVPRVTLPTLKRLMFRGVAVYLENLVAQINAPLLEQLTIELFFELAFTLVALSQFINSTGGLRSLSAKVLFEREGVSIVTNSGESLSSGGLTINVPCEQLDWQIDSAMQCCGELVRCLSAVEELTIDLDENGMPSDWDDLLDSTLWHGLLVSFSSVKKLQIGSSLTFELSDALKSDATELVLNLLPELQMLEVQLEVNDANMAFSTFIETRELEGRPVELLALRAWRKEDRERVIDVLTERADGMFRWVYCHLEYLRQLYPGRVRRALEYLPHTLDATYERTLKDIPKKNWECAQRLFQGVAAAAASRPLRAEELAEFLAFDFDSKSALAPKLEEGWRSDNPVQVVLSTCSSLLAVVNVDDSENIQFAHFSVKESLTSTRLAETTDSISQFHVSMTPAHTTVVQTCLGVLLHIDDNITEDGLERFPLAKYAAEHWVGHARFEDVSSIVIDGLKCLFDPDNRHLAVWVWIYDPASPRRRIDGFKSPPQATVPALHYATICGLHSIVESLIAEHSQDVNTQSFDRNETPLVIACRFGHTEATRVILKRGADTTIRDKDNWSPLKRATANGHVEVVQALLRHGAAVTAQDNAGITALRVSSSYGQPESTRVLLEYGANVNVKRIMNGGTPLHWASNELVARVLLDHGTDPNAQDVYNRTPLHEAVVNQRLEVVRVLLDKDADPNLVDIERRTPLQLASEAGYLDGAHLLLKRSADVHVQDCWGLTPFEVASANRRNEMMKLLLEHGADDYRTY